MGPVSIVGSRVGRCFFHIFSLKMFPQNGPFFLPKHGHGLRLKMSGSSHCWRGITRSRPRVGSTSYSNTDCSGLLLYLSTRRSRSKVYILYPSSLLGTTSA